MVEREVKSEAEPGLNKTSRKPTPVYDSNFPMEPPKFRSYDREANDFSGIDRDISEDIARREEEMEGRSEGEERRFHRETIGAVI
jgi:hypothetical protein